MEIKYIFLSCKIIHVVQLSLKVCKKENGVGGNLESRRARASADDS